MTVNANISLGAIMNTAANRVYPILREADRLETGGNILNLKQTIAIEVVAVGESCRCVER